MSTHAHWIRTSSQQSRWRTPPKLFQALLRIFPIRIDLAADGDSALCPCWCGPGSGPSTENTLAVSGLALTGLVGYTHGFLNPPFSKGEIRQLRDAGVPDDDPRIQALRIEHWAKWAFTASASGFHTIGLFPYAPQTVWFRQYVMGHTEDLRGWSGHAALDYWRIPHRVSFLTPDGQEAANANVNSCIIHWGPNPGFVGPWTPSGRYWTYRNKES